MSSKNIDARGVIWALFFIVVLLVLYDVLSERSVIADFFSGPNTQEGRLQRAVRRAVER